MDFSTINPTNGKILKKYSYSSLDLLKKDLQLLHETFLKWRLVALSKRIEILSELEILLKAHQDEIEGLMALEMGKPLKEGRAEVDKCILLVNVFKAKAPAWLADEIIQADGIENKIIYQPLGVVLGIMPWNFPFWQVFRVAVPALLVGNTVAIKHAQSTAGCGELLEKIFSQLSFGHPLYKNLISDHENLGKLIQERIVEGVSLTGSTRAGKIVGGLAGAKLKHQVLELGGSDAFIVCEDANINKAAAGAVLGRFSNCGQSCIAAKRIFVHQKVFEPFCQELINLLEEKKLGDPQDETVQIGPLVNESALLQITAQFEDALKKGAKVLFQQEEIPKKGYFFGPAVLTHITEKMDIYQQEVFGPLAMIFTFDDEDQAISLANQSDYGLGGSIWSHDLDRAKQLAKNLECGAVFINSITKSDPLMPFGGIKDSGVGRELSRHGLLEFTNVKTINVYKD